MYIYNGVISSQANSNFINTPPPVSESLGSNSGVPSYYPPSFPLNNTPSFHFNAHNIQVNIGISPQLMHIPSNTLSNEEKTVQNVAQPLIEEQVSAQKEQNTHSTSKKRKRGRKPIDKSGFSCNQCGKKDTTQWRKGPLGLNTLCNACGLQYARALREEKQRKGALKIADLLNGNPPLSHSSSDQQTEVANRVAGVVGGSFSQQQHAILSTFSYQPLPGISSTTTSSSTAKTNQLGQEQVRSTSEKKRRRTPMDKSKFKCLDCETTNTTQWRKGPKGKNTLCNACGLRYSKKLKKSSQEAQEEEQRMQNIHDYVTQTNIIPQTASTPTSIRSILNATSVDPTEDYVKTFFS